MLTLPKIFDVFIFQLELLCQQLCLRSKVLQLVGETSGRHGALPAFVQCDDEKLFLGGCVDEELCGVEQIMDTAKIAIHV